MSNNFTPQQVSADAINSNFSGLQGEIETKADLNGDSTQKFKVAGAVELTEAINKGQLDGLISTVNTSISTLETEVATKADKTYVDTNLALKANTSDVNAALATKIDINDTTVTKQGNTFNGPDQLVQLDSNGKLPAIDGSLLTNISGGVLSINVLGNVTSNFTLEANKITTANITASCTLSLPTVTDNTKEAKCILDFTTSNSSYPTLPSGILKKDGKALAFSTLSGVRNRLIFTTIDGGTTWEAELYLYGGVETAFIQNILSSNGTLGGPNQAVYATSEWPGGYEAYRASDNNYSTTWQTAAYVYTASYIRSNPVPVRATSFDFTNFTSGVPSGGIIYGSNDNSNYISLVTFANSNNTTGSTWNVAILPENQNFYSYYKIYFSGVITGTNIILSQITQNGTYMASS